MQMIKLVTHAHVHQWSTIMKMFLQNVQKNENIKKKENFKQVFMKSIIVATAVNVSFTSITNGTVCLVSPLGVHFAHDYPFD